MSKAFVIFLIVVGTIVLPVLRYIFETFRNEEIEM